MAGFVTRQDRLRVPYYSKPVQMELQAGDDDLNASQSSIVQSIKSRVSSFVSRLMGRGDTTTGKDTVKPRK